MRHRIRPEKARGLRREADLPIDRLAKKERWRTDIAAPAFPARRAGTTEIG